MQNDVLRQLETLKEGKLAGKALLAQEILDMIDEYVDKAHKGKITNIVEQIQKRCLQELKVHKD